VLASRLALAAGGLLAPLLGLEFVLRVFGPVLPGDYQTAVFDAPSVELRRTNRPNVTGWRRSNEFTTWVRISSRGLRGPEIEYAKPPDTFRILVLGDSFAMATQVAENQIFAVRLAERLNETGADTRFETVNAGTAGWSTANEYAWLKTEGYRYQPDLVLLMFYIGNDPWDNEDDQVSANRGRARQRRPSRFWPIDEARQALRDISLLYNVFETGVLVKLQAPRLPAQATARREPNPGRVTGGDSRAAGWAASQLYLSQLSGYCAEIGARLLVVGIPRKRDVSAATRTAEPLRLRDINDRLGVAHIDLLEPFRAQPEDARERLYWREDLHWTAEGHDLAAQVVATELQTRLALAGRW
jgi:hypothetical protein